MLTLGIPANPVMALMIGAMIIQGIVPGPNVATEQPALFWGIIASMWIGNLMLIVLNLPLIGLWVKLLTVPYYVLFPIIMAFCSIGVYSVNTNVYDLYRRRLLRPDRLRPGQAALRAGAAAARLRARAAAGGKSAPRDDPVARRSRRPSSPARSAPPCSPSRWPCWSSSSCRRSGRSGRKSSSRKRPREQAALAPRSRDPDRLESMGNQPDALRGILAVICRGHPRSGKGQRWRRLSCSASMLPPSISRQAQIAPPAPGRSPLKLAYINHSSRIAALPGDPRPTA